MRSLWGSLFRSGVRLLWAETRNRAYAIVVLLQITESKTQDPMRAIDGVPRWLVHTDSYLGGIWCGASPV